eukprot:CAMPEP_0183370302 /NCGR_PEP_ID=MMETSP0164_2-20130417/102012_1 /TAXON_ID=221442 /ORGANISM="Coccolithus pelagicus ssp braarudi, Strain PLY182g" /LENGTH=63 /DNA_ID=CAMNT_0025546673 /DNA_START=132 /DNA_END=323 /DNA_ORIENTATION=+
MGNATRILAMGTSTGAASWKEWMYEGMSHEPSTATVDTPRLPIASDTPVARFAMDVMALSGNL